MDLPRPSSQISAEKERAGVGLLLVRFACRLITIEEVLSILIKAVSAGGFPANQSLLAHAFGARRPCALAGVAASRAGRLARIRLSSNSVTSSVTPFRRNTTSLGESAQERGRSTVKPRDTLHGQSVESHSIILGLFGCPCSAYSHTENLESLSCH